MHEIPLSLFALFTLFPHFVTFCFGHVTFRTIECYASDFESVKSDGEGGGVEGGSHAMDFFVCLLYICMCVRTSVSACIALFFLCVHCMCISLCVLQGAFHTHVEITWRKISVNERVFLSFSLLNERGNYALVRDVSWEHRRASPFSFRFFFCLVRRFLLSARHLFVLRGYLCMIMYD